MTRPRVPKRDRNHAEVARAFTSMGCTVLDVSSLPGEALDLLVGCAGIDQRVECKDGGLSPSRRALTDSEARTFRAWRGRPPVVVTSTDEAIRLVYALRAEAHKRGLDKC